MTSINVSPNHGVNPSMVMCFFCGKCKALALMGRLPNDKQAPREAVMDYEPCDKCQALMKQGITLIEVEDKQPKDGRPPIQEGAYPTGRWAVVRDEAINDIVNDPMMAWDIKHKKKALLSKEVTEGIGLFREEIAHVKSID